MIPIYPLQKPGSNTRFKSPTHPLRVPGKQAKSHELVPLQTYLPPALLAALIFSVVSSFIPCEVKHMVGFQCGSLKDASKNGDLQREPLIHNMQKHKHRYIYIYIY